MPTAKATTMQTPPVSQVGDKAQPGDGQSDFYWEYTDEPHRSRRAAILKAHPNVRTLEGYDPRSKYFAIALVAIQTGLALSCHSWSWPLTILVAWAVGGTIISSLTLAVHELSHNLMFASITANRAFAMFAQTPLLFAYATSFRYYHMKHHTLQGEHVIDTDIPTEAEARLLKGIPGKLFFVVFQVFFYALRPILTHPYAPGMTELINWVVCIAYDLAIYKLGGWSAILYLLLSMFFGLGLHPMGAHFLAEHYVFNPGYETYSYYGPLNWLAFFVGYHNEHHDFPRVPGARLSKLRDMAPEFYNTLPNHDSWLYTLWRFITDPQITLFARTKRRRAGASDDKDD